MSQASECMNGLNWTGYNNFSQFESRAHALGCWPEKDEYRGQMYYDFQFDDGSKVTWRANLKTGDYSASWQR